MGGDVGVGAAITVGVAATAVRAGGLAVGMDVGVDVAAGVAVRVGVAVRTGVATGSTDGMVVGTGAAVGVGIITGVGDRVGVALAEMPVGLAAGVAIDVSCAGVNVEGGPNTTGVEVATAGTCEGVATGVVAGVGVDVAPGLGATAPSAVTAVVVGVSRGTAISVADGVPAGDGLATGRNGTPGRSLASGVEVGVSPAPLQAASTTRRRIRRRIKGTPRLLINARAMPHLPPVRDPGKGARQDNP